MKVYLIQQMSEEKIEYSFDNRIITAKIGEVVDTFDFTNVPDGELKLVDEETGKDLIETTLPICPICKAESKNGILYVELLYYIPIDKKPNIPPSKWIKASEYVEPKPIKEKEV